jgi:DNA-directed RNA polymerase subunit RPC12/RpoP
MTEAQILQLEAYGYKMKCSGCGQRFDELYSKGPYNGNKDTEYYCLDCFAEAHGEAFHGDS